MIGKLIDLIKNHKLITGLALGLGVVIGWLAKPQSSSSALSVAAATSAAKSDLGAKPSSTGKRTQREPRTQRCSEASSKIDADEKPSSEAEVAKMVIHINRLNSITELFGMLAASRTGGHKTALVSHFLGNFSVLGGPDQRDKAYEILTQNAGKNLLEESKNPGPPDLSDMFGVVGYESDPYDLQLPEVEITTEKFEVV